MSGLDQSFLGCVPLRILTVVHSLAKGGTERAAQNFAVAYSALGHDSRVLYTRIDGVRKEALIRKGIRIYFLGDPENLKEVKAWDPNIVHLHSHDIYYEEFCILKDLLPKPRYFETNVFSRPSPWAEEIDVSFQLSKWCNWLFQNAGGRKFPTAIVPNPVDCEAFRYAGDEREARFRRVHGMQQNDLIIGRVGQNSESKWSSLLIEVFECLRGKEQKLKLLLVNPPSFIVKLARNSLFKEDIIHIEQILDDEALVDCYSAIDVFVLIADRGESFGMVLAESLLCETPVVTLSTPWGDNSQGEVIGNRIGGYVAATRRELPTLVNTLLVNEDLRKKLGANGRARVLELFRSEKIAKDALSYYKNTPSRTITFPAKLANDAEGEIGYVSRLILEIARWISIRKLTVMLRFTTGYWSWSCLPKFFYGAARQKIVNNLRLWKGKAS